MTIPKPDHSPYLAPENYAADLESHILAQTTNTVLGGYDASLAKCQWQVVPDNFFEKQYLQILSRKSSPSYLPIPSLLSRLAPAALGLCLVMGLGFSQRTSPLLNSAITAPYISGQMDDLTDIEQPYEYNESSDIEDLAVQHYADEDL